MIDQLKEAEFLSTVEELNGHSLMKKVSLMIDFIDLAVKRFKNMSTNNSNMELGEYHGGPYLYPKTGHSNEASFASFSFCP